MFGSKFISFYWPFKFPINVQGAEIRKKKKYKFKIIINQISTISVGGGVC